MKKKEKKKKTQLGINSREDLALLHLQRVKSFIKYRGNYVLHWGQTFYRGHDYRRKLTRSHQKLIFQTTFQKPRLPRSSFSQNM